MLLITTLFKFGRALVVELAPKNGLLKLGVCALIAVLLWIVPVPSGLEPKGWKIFAVFLAVIVSFVVRPYPMGPMVLFGLVILMAGNTLTTHEALSGYGDSTVWLVVAAFLIAGGVVHTGFGRRLALMLVSRFGKSILGLGYSLCAAELVLGPVVPSNTARGGGILAPITLSLCEALGSYPHQNPQRAGKYLSLVGAHANLIAAAMFLTGMAANPLVSRAAREVFNVDFDWGTWAIGALVPAIIGFSLLPLLIYCLAKPTLRDTSAALENARRELQQMGHWRTGEKVMSGVFILLIVLWATKALHGLDTTLAAWIGVCLLLLTNTLKWEEVISNDKAWDTLIWLGGLLAMANGLKAHGFIDWFAKNVEALVSGFSGMTVIFILALIYFYSMYGFSMVTAHISALVAAFFAVAATTGAPVMLTIAILAYFSNLCACTTNYSSGPVIVYYGLGYVPANQWFATGFMVSLFHLIVWLGAGLPAWKVLGWW